MTMYGYDPARMVMLRTNLLDATCELRRLSCPDPAAAHAMRVVRLMRQNLEETWLPLVDGIHSSTAMVAWRRSAGLAEGSTERIISRLIERFGAVSSWLPVAALGERTGLGALGDHELVDKALAAADGLVAAIDTGGDLGAPWRRLERLIDEMARRVQLRDGFGAQFWAGHGLDGLDLLLEMLDRTGQIHALGLLGGVDRSDTAAGRLHGSLAIILGDLFAVEAEALAAALDSLALSAALIDLPIHHPSAFSPGTITMFASELVLHTAGRGRWADRARVDDHRARADAMLALVARVPGTALDLIGHPDVAAGLATSIAFDTNTVEQLLAAALGSAAMDPGRGVDRALAWAGFVDVSRTAALSIGASRGLARAMGTALPWLSVHLDRRLQVQIAVPGTEPIEVVDLGTHADLSAMIGQLMEDEAAQLTLGLVVGAFRLDQQLAALDAIAARPQASPEQAMAQLSAAMVDATRSIKLLVSARTDRDALHVFQHGLARARSASVLSLLGSTLSWTLQPTVPLAQQMTTLSTTVIATALNASRPAQVPVTGIEAELAINFTATLLALPVMDPTRRAVFGLVQVPPGTWTRLEQLLERLADEEDPRERTRIHSMLTRVVSENPDLDRFVDQMRSLTGEDQLQ
jgi:hypothetical protein